MTGLSGEVHVTPVEDTCDHELLDSCVCGPCVEPAPYSDGSIGWIVVHHSLDGREVTE